jgi:hypothetical protein
MIKQMEEIRERLGAIRVAAALWNEIVTVSVCRDHGPDAKVEYRRFPLKFFNKIKDDKVVGIVIDKFGKPEINDGF